MAMRRYVTCALADARAKRRSRHTFPSLVFEREVTSTRGIAVDAYSCGEIFAISHTTAALLPLWISILIDEFILNQTPWVETNIWLCCDSLSFTHLLVAPLPPLHVSGGGNGFSKRRGGSLGLAKGGVYFWVGPAEGPQWIPGTNLHGSIPAMAQLFQQL